MKKNLLYTLGVLLSSGAILTACSSDDGVSESVSNKIEAGKTYYMTVNAARQADTRALEEDKDDSGINATWATSDNVYVLYNGSSIGTLHPNVAAIDANLSGYINSNESVSLPADIPILFPRAVIDYHGQIGTLENIAEKYDYAKATPRFISETSNTISAAESVVFSNQQAIVKFTLTDEGNESLNVSSLRISATDLKETGDRTGDITITPTSSSTNVLYAALSGINNTQVTLTAQVDNAYYVYRKNGVTFADGKFYDIPVQMRALTVGKSLTEIDPGYIGWVVGSDGNVYPAADAVPSGTTAVAMVAYVYKDNSDNIHGLAIALNDEAEGNKLTQLAAATAASAHKPVIKNYTWRLPSREDWKKMFIGCGGASIDDEYKVNYTCFNSKLATVGGQTFLAGATYWSSSGFSHYLSFDGKEVDMTNTNTDALYNVRACLSW